jgi:hypothetical protein
MTHFDWEMQDQYDKDFIQGLELIKRIDLAQFVIDLSINDKATFELLRTLMNNQVMNRQVNENRNC